MADKIDRETLVALARYLEDPDNAFVMQAYVYLSSLVEEDDLPRSAIAFEAMASAFSAFEAGKTHSDIRDAYPVRAWREDTVEVPRAWLRELVECWEKYKKAPESTDLGEAFGIDGSGQGRRPVRARLGRRKRDIRRVNLVVDHYLSAVLDEDRPSWNRAIEAVAEHEGVSADTVKRASGRLKERVFDRLRFLGVID